jgi:hypothetical protein
LLLNNTFFDWQQSKNATTMKIARCFSRSVAIGIILLVLAGSGSVVEAESICGVSLTHSDLYPKTYETPSGSDTLVTLEIECGPDSSTLEITYDDSSTDQLQCFAYDSTELSFWGDRTNDVTIDTITAYYFDLSCICEDFISKLLRLLAEELGYDEQEVNSRPGGSISSTDSHTIIGSPDITAFRVYGDSVEVNCECSVGPSAIMVAATDEEAREVAISEEMYNDIKRNCGGSRTLSCPNGCDVIVGAAQGFEVTVNFVIENDDPTDPPTNKPVYEPTRRPTYPSYPTRPTTPSYPTRPTTPSYPTRPTAPSPSPDDICFAASASVEVLGKGTTVMKDLEIGDKVLVGNGKHEVVYAFGHRDPSKEADFLALYITHEGTTGHPLEVSPRHLVYIKGKDHPIMADSLQVGDILQGSHDSIIDGGSIKKIKKITRCGVYAPLTPSGNIVVDGFMVSTYVALQQKGSSEFPKFANGLVLPISQHHGIHIGTSPFRILCMGVSTMFCSRHTEEGILSWVDYGMRLADHVEKQRTLVQLLWLFLALVVCLPFYVMEVAFGPKIAPFALVMTFGCMGTIVFKKLGTKTKEKTL